MKSISVYDELLEKCPFCGRSARVIGEWVMDEDTKKRRFHVYAQCSLCKARIDGFIVDPDTAKDGDVEKAEHDAVEAWNYRWRW